MDPMGKTTGKYGGSIREAGGTLGSLEAAKEELYFRQQDEKQFQALREKMAEKQQQQQANERSKEAQK
jgi:hypothetical protein